MNKRTLYIDGIAFWSPSLNSWAVARAAFRGDVVATATATAATTATATVTAAATASTLASTVMRPAPALMAANERRRASDSVLVALEVAAQAVAASGHAAKDLASVFTSAHGDLPITDALCKTLATDPLLLSPMRFHHSVHNAASGYWAISSGSTAASTALAGFKCSFANGLLEAASQCASQGAGDSAPRLLVGFDTQAMGPLASVNRSRGLMGVALVLSPTPSAASRWCLHWGVDSPERQALETALKQQAPPQPAGSLRSAAAQALAQNASADALPLFEALATDCPQSLALSLGPTLQLVLDLVPIVTAGPSPVAA